jgi:hypothetical protein
VQAGIAGPAASAFAAAPPALRDASTGEMRKTSVYLDDALAERLAPASRASMTISA